MDEPDCANDKTFLVIFYTKLVRMQHSLHRVHVASKPTDTNSAMNVELSYFVLRVCVYYGMHVISKVFTRCVSVGRAENPRLTVLATALGTVTCLCFGWNPKQNVLLQRSSLPAEKNGTKNAGIHVWYAAKYPYV